MDDSNERHNTPQVCAVHGKSTQVMTALQMPPIKIKKTLLSHWQVTSHSMTFSFTCVTAGTVTDQNGGMFPFLIKSVAWI
jgi:hypothetical protein